LPFEIVIFIGEIQRGRVYTIGGANAPQPPQPSHGNVVLAAFSRPGSGRWAKSGGPWIPSFRYSMLPDKICLWTSRFNISSLILQLTE